MIPMLQEVDRTERLLHLTPRGSYGDWNPGEGPYEFHRRLPGYAPSPLREADVIAAEFGLERFWVKDESLRFGLPAFKVLGASWATYRALDRRLRAVTGSGFGRWYDLADLRSAVEPLRPLTLTCATDGNHGRAVAHMARRLGLEALIYVPLAMSEARRDAISGEGAQVVEVDGTYDDAVRLAALEQTPDRLVIADTSWPGYEDVPRWVIDGYSTIIREIETYTTEHNVDATDLVVVPIGVGALAASVIAAVRRWLGESVFILGVEPTQAASTLASLEVGRLVQIPGPHDSIMAGLNCGQPSGLAWPVVSGGLNGIIAIDDERARDGMRQLAREGIVAGECGAAGIGGLRAWIELAGEPLPGRRALVISTEGATDPDAYATITSNISRGAQRAEELV